MELSPATALQARGTAQPKSPIALNPTFNTRIEITSRFPTGCGLKEFLEC